MALGAAKTYNLANVIFTVGGIPIEGFSDDDAVSIEPNADLYETTVGADGEVTRSAMNDRSALITFTLKSTSLSNDLFNTFLQLTKTVAVGDMFPLYLKDLNSGDEVIAEQCWLEREPDMAFGRSASDREWSVRAAKVTTTHGGSFI